MDEDQLVAFKLLDDESKRLVDAGVASIRDLGVRARSYVSTGALALTVAIAINGVAYGSLGLGDSAAVWAVVGLTAGLVLFLVMLVLALVIDGPGDVAVTGRLDELRRQISDSNGIEAWRYHDWMYSARMDAHNENAAVINRRGTLLQVQLIVLALEIFVVAATLLGTFAATTI